MNGVATIFGVWWAARSRIYGLICFLMMNEDPESIRRLHYYVMTCPSLMAMAYAVSLDSVTLEWLLDLVDHLSPRDK